MKNYMFLWWALSLLLPSTVIGQLESEKGEIAGTVVNVSLDSSTIANQKIILYQYVDNQELQDERPFIFTDDHGRFRFQNVVINEHNSYYPLTVYNGLEYSGNLIKPTPLEPRLNSDISVYESTSSDSAISIVGHHLFIESGMNDLIIKEIFMMVNNDIYTYVGKDPAANGKNIVLPMEIPVNAKELQFGGDLMGCCVIVDDNRIFDTMGLIPGIRNVELQYLLPKSQSEIDFTKTIAFSTETIDIFASDPIRISENSFNNGVIQTVGSVDNPLIEANPIQMPGGNYNHYKKSKLAQGSTIALTISNVPNPKRDYRWLAPVVLILIITMGFFINRKYGKVSSA